MELTESIREHGLLQPIVCREAEGKIILSCGERRLRAIKDLWALGGALRMGVVSFPEGEIPYISVGELNALQIQEVELEENVRRKNLTWQEEADALRRLKALRDAQAAERGETSTVADLAVEVKGSDKGSYHDSVRKSLIVAEHLGDPEVAAAKSVGDAYKILVKKEENRKNERLATEVGKTFNASVHKLFNCGFQQLDTFTGIASQFDVILTDPPYGMGADQFGDAAGALVAQGHEYEDSYENWKALMPAMIGMICLAAKPQAHAYIFCDFDRFHELKEIFERQCFPNPGWEIHRTPLVWNKLQAQRVPWPDYGPRRQYEICLYAVKGKKPTTAIYPDVIEAKPDENLGHAAQKPVDLLVNLLRRSVRPGDRVLDLFAGTGSIFPAAHQLKCAATACEISKASYGIALKRLKDLELQVEMGL